MHQRRSGGVSGGQAVGVRASRSPTRTRIPIPQPQITTPEADTAGRLETVLGIAARLAASHDREELFRTIVDETNRGLRADATTIRIIRDGRIEVAAWAGLSDEIAARLPAYDLDEGWVGTLIRTRRVVAWSDVRAVTDQGHDRYHGIVEFVGTVTAPLIYRDQVIGSLSSVTREPRDWTSGDIAFISTLASHAAIALINADLFAQTETRAAQLETLQAASARMSRAGTVAEVGRTVVEETRRMVDYHNARMYLIEPPDRVVPIAFEGSVGAYERVDCGIL